MQYAGARVPCRHSLRVSRTILIVQPQAPPLRRTAFSILEVSSFLCSPNCLAFDQSSYCSVECTVKSWRFFPQGQGFHDGIPLPSGAEMAAPKAPPASIPTDFPTSCERYKDYPTNLLHRTDPAEDLTAYKIQLDQSSRKLFLSNGTSQSILLQLLDLPDLVSPSPHSGRCLFL
jgi:hypothetical protein